MSTKDKSKATTNGGKANKPTPILSAAVVTAMAGLRAAAGAQAEDTPKSLTLFGKDTFLAAVKAADSAIAEVKAGDEEIRKLDGEILLKKEGNTAKLYRVAVKCVELTTTDVNGKKTAHLENAAQLFLDSCMFAEEKFLANWANANPGGDARIQVVVPSWSVMRSEFYNAMKKAGINPTEHVQGTKVREAYKAWKSNPDNAEGKDTRGRQTGARTPTGPTPQASAAITSAEMTENLKTALRTMVGTLQGMTPSQQNEAAEIIAETTLRLSALIGEDSDDAPDEGVTGSRTAPKGGEAATA